MMNELAIGETRKPLYECLFSPDRVYRYTLEEVWDRKRGRIQFIGLNPSTADEYQLDPTLKRIRAWSEAWGFGGFVMTNLFAFRSPHPTVMQAHADPVGPGNDRWIYAEAKRAEKIVAAWGAGGLFMGRAGVVMSRIRDWTGKPVFCLGTITGGFPIHPMARGKHRVADDVQLVPYP